MRIELIGFIRDGRKRKDIRRYWVAHPSGAFFTAIDYAATIQNLWVPDAKGRFDDLVLGFDTVCEYSEKSGFHGAAVGRNANRIRGASFSLDRQVYRLPKNDGPNNLHSGPQGFHNRVWKGRSVGRIEAQRFLDESALVHPFEIVSEGVIFFCYSPHLDNGFPGNLLTEVLYAWSKDQSLVIAYKGTSDRKTIFNPTQHAYFNLGGHHHGSVGEHLLKIDAKQSTRKGANGIPDGSFFDVKDTPFDFTNPTPMAQTMTLLDDQLKWSDGLDQNYCLKEGKDGHVREVAWLEDPSSGRKMTVLTDACGMHVYAGNHLDGTTGKGGWAYENYGGICLETQFYPDAIHHEHFLSPLILPDRPTYHMTAYRLT